MTIDTNTLLIEGKELLWKKKDILLPGSEDKQKELLYQDKRRFYVQLQIRSHNFYMYWRNTQP